MRQLPLSSSKEIVIVSMQRENLTCCDSYYVKSVPGIDPFVDVGSDFRAYSTDEEWQLSKVKWFDVNLINVKNFLGD